MIPVAAPEIIKFPDGGASYRWEPGDGTRYQAIVVRVPDAGLGIGGMMGGIDGPGYLITWNLTGKSVLLPEGSLDCQWVLEQVEITNPVSQFQFLLFLEVHFNISFGVTTLIMAKNLVDGAYPVKCLGPMARALEEAPQTLEKTE